MERCDNSLGVDSLKQIQSTSEGAPEAFARRYQLETFAVAKEKNTIAYLETGSGKTLIAVLLIRAFAHLLRKPQKQIAVFVAPKVCLVHQQAEVLDIHTDLNIGRFYGDMGLDLWDLKRWQEQLRTFEVLVMTPQVLLDNLRHCFFEIKMIKLLIFDECHHARKKDPYACIMNEFYQGGTSELPLIFGMTASPVFSKGVPSEDLRSLETTLHAQIFTLQDRTELEEVVPTPTLFIKYYDAACDFVHKMEEIKWSLENIQKKHCDGVAERMKGTAFKDLKELVSNAERRIKKMHLTIIHCLLDLGLLSAFEAAGILQTGQGETMYITDLFRNDILEKIRSNFVQEARQVLLSFLPPGWNSIVKTNITDIMDADLSTSKFQALVHTILEYRNVGCLQCIIFVRRIITARTLAIVLSNIGCLSFLRCEYVAGRNTILNDQNQNQQQDIINQFRSGQVNLLFATSIAEEGLDIQCCNLVICFDLPEIISSLIQSRGRVRKADSHYVLLIDRSNPNEEAQLSALLTIEKTMRQEVLHRKDMQLSFDHSQDLSAHTYRVESTGATANLDSSVALIYYYCSQLPNDRYYTPRPEFVFEDETSSCTLKFPPNAPISKLTVQNGNKSLQKKLVCLEACKQLHALNALTDHLLPVAHEDEEEISLDIKGRKELHPHFIPESLAGNLAASTEQVLFHCYFISFRAQSSSWNSINFCLLVENSLNPDVTNTEIQLGVGAVVVLSKPALTGIVELHPRQVEAARIFQEVIIRLLLDKKLAMLSPGSAWEPEQQYFLLPLLNYTKVSNSDAVYIDWGCIDVVLSSVGLESTRTTEISCEKRPSMSTKNAFYSTNKKLEALHTADGQILVRKIENSIVSMIHSDTYYCITGVLKDINANCYMSAAEDRKLANCSYFDYFSKRYGVTLRYPDQPLLEAHSIPGFQKFLSRHQQTYSEAGSFLRNARKSSVELPPELCRIRVLGMPWKLLYSFSFLPFVMHRLEAMLIASQFKQTVLGSCPSSYVVPTAKLLEALTTKSCQESLSLESLETLGDSFLKYAVSRQLFLVYSQQHEGQLTKKRMTATCNYTLYKIAVKKDIPGYIQLESYDANNWPALGKHIIRQSNSGHNRLTHTQEETCGIVDKKQGVRICCYRLIKLKTVADVVEALIGAHLTSGGESSALTFMNWLGIEVNISPTLVKQVSTCGEVHPGIFEHFNIHALSDLLNYSFTNPIFLINALTHASCPDILGVGCYQRLEFLGDALLDYAMTSHLYTTHPGLTPKVLSDLRSAAVNNDCFSKVAVKLNLQRHLRHGSGFLHNEITQFVTFIRNLLPSDNQQSFGWIEAKAPKVLGDLIESIAGAIFLDSDLDLQLVWRVMKPLLEPIVTPETLPFQPVRELFEFCHKRGAHVKFEASHKGNCTIVQAKVAFDDSYFEETAQSTDKESAKKLAAQKLLHCLKPLQTMDLTQVRPC